MLNSALWQVIYKGLDNGWALTSRFLHGRISEALDPNHARTQAEHPEGAVLVPIAVCGPRTDDPSQCRDTLRGAWAPLEPA